jgi:hypothetical protein
VTYPSGPDPYQQNNPYQQPDPYQQNNPYQPSDPYQQGNPYQPQGNPYQQGNPYEQQQPPQYQPPSNPYEQQQPPQYQPQGYGSPYGQPYQPPQPQTTNGAAITSLVFGILGGILFSVIFGIIALVQIPKRNQKGKGMAIAGLVLSGLWLLGCGGLIALGVFADKADSPTGSSNLPSVVQSETPSASSDDVPLKVGDCINGLLDQNLDTELKETPPAVACAEPHEGEVFKVIQVKGTLFPGDSEVQKQAESGCSASALRAYGQATKIKNLEIYYLYPTSKSWTFGDRDITCLVVNEKAKMTGSVRK